ncbi:hypothetical protein NST50_26105 [Paenibacillus sp. FSL E2-0202]|uniref:hypothetical protein n=1 Tax=Paenibacillus sp. FSL E2-0202 TaxID=2954505 RepID=UPI0030ECEB2E
MKTSKPGSKHSTNLSEQTAQQFVNVQDIRDHFLYTRDGWLLCYLRISPISLDLLSSSEKKLLINKLTAELSSIRFPFKFLAVSRPVDISPLISELVTGIPTADPKQKELLRQEIAEMNNFALSGEVVERQFYLILWQQQANGERDLLEKSKRLVQHFEDGQVQAHVLKQHEIVQLCNLVNNPSFIHLEDPDFSTRIPLLKEV